MSRLVNTGMSEKPTRVGQLLATQAKSNAGAVALLEPGLEPLTYAGLLRQVETLQRQLRDFGIGPRHRVALVMPNASATATLILALMDCCTLVPLNPAYRRREIESLYARIGIDTVVTQCAADHACRDCARARGIPTIGVIASTRVSGQCELTLPRVPRPRSIALAHDCPPALVLHTSGSTAKPKIVPLTHRNLLASIENLTASLKLTGDDRCLNMMPMFHIGALVDLLLAPVSVGASIVVPREISARSFFDCLGKFAPTWYQGVPTMLREIVNLLKSNPALIQGTRPLRLVRSVSSALPNRLLHEVEKMLETTVVEIYGMTETAGVICSNPVEPGAQKQGSVGLPRGCDVRILDSNGAPVAIGERGEVVVRGDNVMAAYETRKDPSAQLDNAGFLHTGDEGYFDAEGYLYLCGRIREIINRGGEKISPLEIDRVAEQHPAVQAAAAFAIPHPSLGEEVGLALVTDRDADYSEAGLIAFLDKRLSPHKMPRRIVYPAKLPRAAGGKLKRHLLTEELEQQDSRQQPARWIAPESELARELAKLWETALDTGRIGMRDNFFDRGGDSLSAASVIGELKSRYPAIHASALYDHPTLSDLEDYLRGQSDQAQQDATALVPEAQILDVLLPFMSAWRGDRLSGHRLLQGRNTAGNRPPLFWCVNSFGEFDALATSMDNDQPVYGMRSLSDTGYKSDGATLRLARIYIDEMLQVQPRGPYLVGGFCEGGKVAFQVALMLRAKGEIVASLMLHEQFVASPYSGRVAMFVCRPGRNNPYYSFHDAVRGWRKYYSGELRLYRTNGRHIDSYQRPDVDLLGLQLRREMAHALSYSHDESIDRCNRLQRLPLDAYRARVEVAPPRRVRPGSRFRIDVSVTNVSSFDWLPTRSSGLILGARWIRPDRNNHFWMAGSSDIPRVLHPGDSAKIPVTVRAPWRPSRLFLELDLVDDGVSWFRDMGSQANRHQIDISILALN